MLANNENHQRRQQVLQSKISNVVRELEEEENRYSELERKLADVERRVQFQARTLRKLETQIAKSHQRLTELGIQQAEQQDALTQQQRLLAKQLRASWMAGNQERLQLWLEGADVNFFGPVLTWYDYINKSRATNVVDLAAELEQLAETERQIKDEQAALASLRDNEKDNIGQLKMAREQRAQLLNASRKRIQAEKSQLKQLQAEQARLDALIERLKDLAASAPPSTQPSTPSKPFAKLTGALRWPVKGKIIHDYGAPRADGRLKWNGVTIKAERGQKVRSVASGEVIFADWLGRLGLLMIVDHGDNYLTLYGHNQALYKKPGEKVAPGDLIASVGDSGGRTESALYFEVRKGSGFRNPHLWCKKRAL